MPKRTDIHKVMIIGSGPIIIGQACEFDYSGTQACKALRSLGYEIVLVNSNPATIMTDPGTADRTYIEPLNVERLTAIIEKERPDAILPNLGGQSALNLSSELSKTGVLDKYGVKVIGVQVDAIERGEDREAFKELMNDLGIEMAKSKVAYSVDEAVDIARELGYPCVLRPAYTMGGTGGGLVYNIEELRTVVKRGLAASPVHEVLVEESVLGWEELEFEVVRDANGKMITVCTIENIDPMGIHTGDSFCVAPMQTIAQETIDRLQEKSYRIVDAVKVIGGTNVQWAHDPVSDRDIIIEINPRTSRSSALASPAASRSTRFLAASGARSTSTIPMATTSSSSSPAGPLRSSRASRTVWARRCAPWARSCPSARPTRKPSRRPFARLSRAAMASALPRTSTRSRWGSSSTCWPTPPASASSSCTRRCARAPRLTSCTR